MANETSFPTIYSQGILELAGNIPRQGRLKAPGATAKAHSKLCGSTVIVDLTMEDGRVVDFAHEVRACALGQAAASIMARNVIGSTGEELRALREQVRAMLKEHGPPPQGKWAAIALLEPVRDFKARHASTLLTFEAAADCVDQIETAAAQGAWRSAGRSEAAPVEGIGNDNASREVVP
jgi:NifU-like protein involved in Fe-S cluster formation